jgi:hypothetical protein
LGFKTALVVVILGGNMLKFLLCFFGFHDFESNPSLVDYVKETGCDFLFWSGGVQKGAKKCKREGCGCLCKVYRFGFAGAGGKAGDWQKLSRGYEKLIDSLPRL